MADEGFRLPSFSWLLCWLALILVVVAIGFRDRPDAPSLSDVDAPMITSGDALKETSAAGSAGTKRFLTSIRRPSGPPVIELNQADPQGRSGNVACSTCHSVREPNFANRTPADLDQFHQNMPMAHGALSCYSCHNADDTDTLRLADSTPVDYSDVMTLCAQCHGTQSRDYLHGAHGGMNGYWDLSRGPRTRNNCVDCHDPHVPKFPTMQPTFKPRDRFLAPHSETSQHSSFHSESNDE